MPMNSRVGLERLEAHRAIEGVAPLDSFRPAVFDDVEYRGLHADMGGGGYCLLECVREEEATEAAALLAFVDGNHGKVDGWDAP